jgi:hypothetical protein
VRQAGICTYKKYFSAQPSEPLEIAEFYLESDCHDPRRTRLTPPHVARRLLFSPPLASSRWLHTTALTSCVFFVHLTRLQTGPILSNIPFGWMYVTSSSVFGFASDISKYRTSLHRKLSKSARARLWMQQTTLVGPPRRTVATMSRCKHRWYKLA